MRHPPNIPPCRSSICCYSVGASLVPEFKFTISELTFVKGHDLVQHEYDSSYLNCEITLELNFQLRLGEGVLV
jgi:hypothetical protein